MGDSINVDTGEMRKFAEDVAFDADEMMRPDLVRAVVTLGSPHGNPYAVHPLVWTQGAAIATLAALGVPGLASRHTDLIEDECDAILD